MKYFINFAIRTKNVNDNVLIYSVENPVCTNNHTKTHSPTHTYIYIACYFYKKKCVLSITDATYMFNLE